MNIPMGYQKYHIPIPGAIIKHTTRYCNGVPIILGSSSAQEPVSQELIGRKALPLSLHASFTKREKAACRGAIQGGDGPRRGPEHSHIVAGGFCRSMPIENS